LPTLDENRYWDRYAWPQDGDEWSDQAAFCGVPYTVWKAAIVSEFIARHVRDTSTVLEIGPGHARWTAFLATGAKRYVGVDINASCVEFCRTKLASLPNSELVLGDGYSLPMIGSQTVDFVWSFDSFVHIEPEITDSYLAEFARVLVDGGRCCIHHPGNPDAAQRKNGWRSAVTRESFAEMATSRGLRVVRQQDSWGPGGVCNTRRFGDCISTIEKA
jgi:ubiquinone/menaquinone biosynthesis C-methylase UbiE